MAGQGHDEMPFCFMKCLDSTPPNLDLKHSGNDMTLPGVPFVAADGGDSSARTSPQARRIRAWNP